MTREPSALNLGKEYKYLCSHMKLERIRIKSGLGGMCEKASSVFLGANAITLQSVLDRMFVTHYSFIPSVFSS